jgi:2'-5' RNA ligase
MPYAVTLPLDECAADHVQTLWRVLAEQAGSDDAIRVGYTPHITLSVLPDASSASDIERAAFRVAGKWEPLSVILAGLGVFPGPGPVSWIAPVVTAELLSRHAELHEALRSMDVHPHYRPESWMPHVTLTQGRTVAVANAIACANAAWRGPISARLERIDIVRFHPAELLQSRPLRAGA